ncbi:MAG TPA: M23 family metallopeptidase [Candidatus Binataceae bacterium]|nr:M23 family metallopeptidase [Candidatus Binataceae bacterium]
MPVPFNVESAQPAPAAVRVSTVLDQTAPAVHYLEASGLNADEALQWASVFKQHAHTGTMVAGHALTLYKDPDSGALRGFRYNLDYRQAVMELGLGSGLIRIWEMPIQYELRPVLIAFPVQGDFRSAAAEHGVPNQIVNAVEKAFDSRQPLNRLEPGTTIKMIYQEKVARDGSWRVPNGLEAAQLELDSGKTFDAFAFSDGSRNAHLYDAQGRALDGQTLRFPVNFNYISSGFTFSRYHPLLHIYRPHLGIDLATRYGEPVKAVADGRVTTAGWCGELGRCIRIEHPGDIATIYGHLSQISTSVQPGAQVRGGQVIGKVGSSGLSTGPHLHFAVVDGDRFVNPLTERLGENHPISPRMRALFDDLKARYEAALNNLRGTGSAEAALGPPSPVTAVAAIVPEQSSGGGIHVRFHHHLHHRYHHYRTANAGDAGGAEGGL